MAGRKKAKTEFGLYLVQAIKDAKMVQEDFYTAVGITKPYFYDILTGSPPPQKILEKMLEILNQKLPADETRRSTFFDMAARCRNEIPIDISEMIMSHPDSWCEIRTVLTELFR